MMGKRILLIICAFLVFLLASVPAIAAVATPSRLYDGADLLYEEEKTEILEKVNRISSEYKVDVIIVTLDTLGGYSADEYVEYYYDTNGYGQGIDRDGVMLLVAMDERSYRILSNGLGAAAITRSEIDYIGEEVASYLSYGEYAEAFHTFADLCEYELEGEINGFPFQWKRNLLISLVIGFVVALVATGIMRAQLKSVRMQTNATQYTKQGSMRITTSNDLFLYRTLNRRRKENSASGSHSRSGSGSRNVGGGRF